MPLLITTTIRNMVETTATNVMIVSIIISILLDLTLSRLSSPNSLLGSTLQLVV
jgi:hypothetical protein